MGKKRRDDKKERCLYSTHIDLDLVLEVISTLRDIIDIIKYTFYKIIK